MFIILKNNSCEVEYFVETHFCKLGGILRLRVLWVLYGLMQEVQSIYEEDKRHNLNILVYSNGAFAGPARRIMSSAKTWARARL